MYPYLSFDAAVQGTGAQSRPHPAVPMQSSQSTFNSAQSDTSNTSGFAPQVDLLIHEPRSTNHQNTYTTFQPLASFDMSSCPQTHALQPVADFPINWLPPDPSLAIDYNNIVGLGLGSLDFFSFPNASTDVNSIPDASRHESNGAVSVTNLHYANHAQRRNAHLSPAGEGGGAWHNHSPGITESHISSSSPRSSAYTISPSDAPGGLYATSGNGARMPCTIRARRASRLIPGAQPIRPLDRLLTNGKLTCDQHIYFPNTGHISIDDEMDTASNVAKFYPTISDGTYDEMLHAFHRICLGETSLFSAYTDSVFPSLQSLNMCVRLYYEHFDPIMPVLHEQIAAVNDHWVLALAASAIGCQYVEADEYSQLVEPMHEFLRRCIVVEMNSKTLERIGREKEHIALAQAVLLSQVGMLYSGSLRLLSFAKAQSSAAVELAQALMHSTGDEKCAPTNLQEPTACNHQHQTWMNLLLDECRRRLCHSFWVSYNEF